MTQAGLDYLKAVEQQLSGKKAQKKAYLKKLAADVAERLEEEPELDSAALASAFGLPEELAAEFMGTLDVKDVKKAFNWKKIVLIGVIVALLIWFIVVIASLINGFINGSGYTVDEIVDIPSSSMTSERSKT